jgi:hypothetical protein
VSAERDSLKLAPGRGPVSASMRSWRGCPTDQVEVTIMGQSYMLACPAGGETMLHAGRGQRGRGDVPTSATAGKVKARERIAVLAALNLAYQLAEVPADSR